MKKYFGFISIVLVVACSSFVVSTVEMDNVLVALKSGNASQLSKYFDNRVDISLPDNADNYSRTQAEMIMREFFHKNSVRSFDLRYKSGNAETNYCIGTLQTNGGNYRTTLFMKQKGDKQYLQDLRFQKLD